VAASNPSFYEDSYNEAEVKVFSYNEFQVYAPGLLATTTTAITNTTEALLSSVFGLTVTPRMRLAARLVARGLTTSARLMLFIVGVP